MRWFQIVISLAALLMMPPAIASPTDSLLYSFGASATDGVGPIGGLIQGPDGSLYGTTSAGGEYDGGTVFSTGTSGGNYQTVYSFTGSGDGFYPPAALTFGTDGFLYGAAEEGGWGTAGLIFQMSTDGTIYNLVHSFQGGFSDGAYQEAATILGPDGNLYGTTTQGGAYNDGVVYKIGTDGSGFTILHSFDNTDDGYNPGCIIFGHDGNLYGTTQNGAADGDGALFTVARDGTSFSVLHVFTGGSSDGANPVGNLVQLADDQICGTTSAGGSDGDGTIFSIQPDGLSYGLLHMFAGGASDGADPVAGLTIGSDNNLYGVTRSGGNGDGVVFEYKSSGGNYSVVYSFAASGDAAQADGALLQGVDGSLYGTSVSGGANGAGCIYNIPIGLSAAPTGVAAFGGDHQVGLSWNAVPGASSYNVYNVLDSTKIANVTVTNYTDTTAPNGDREIYDVTAVVGGVETSASYQVSAIPVPAVTGLSFSRIGLAPGDTATGTITFTNSSNSATTVTLISSDPSTPVSGPVTIPAGQTSATFTTTAGSVSQATTSAITAETNSGGSSATLTIGVSLQTFPAGLEMICASASYTGQSLSQIFDISSVKLAAWSGSSYVVSPTSPADTLTAGMGYWARIPATANLLDVGQDTIPFYPVDVSLQQGWNIVGDPFAVGIQASSLQVQFGTVTDTLADANSAGYIGDTFYTYQASDTAYEVDPASTSTLLPYEGYWIYAYRPCTMIFPAPY